MRSPQIRAGALASIFVLTATFSAPILKADESRAPVPPQSSAGRSTWAGPFTLGSFVHKVVDGRVACREASADQARNIKDRDTNIPLTILTPDPDPTRARTGLRIILRGTSQLQSFPNAIEVFKRAAARWEAQIQNVMTVVIDVDFGPTLFGKPFDVDVASSASAQILAGNSFYPAVRADLTSGPFPPDRLSLYGSLPREAVPTDRGESAGLTASSATLRALDLLDPIADPNRETSDLGAPPAIGLNSRFKFGFDLGEGVKPDELDFVAIVLHEIGHILGFVSFVGQQEMNPSQEVEPSIWDLFRVSADATASDFTATKRILSSGGEQSFYAGGAKRALSTARPDGAGGDGRHGSHWKDDDLTGQYIGVMDPTIGFGQRQFITDDDLSVLDAIGYRTKSLIDPTIVVSLTPALPEAGAMIAPPPGLGVLSHIHYSIAVPPGATKLKIELSGNQDVDLYARYGRPVVNQRHTVIADYRSATNSNSETITVTPSSSPPLAQGIFYAAMANFGPGDAEFTVTATVIGGNVSHAPAIFNVRPRLRGDVLEVDCAAMDRDGDFAMAAVSILDEAGRAVSPLSTSAISAGNSPRIETQLKTGGLGALPTAQRASVVFIDRSGNRSAEATVDFSKAEAGGLTLTSGSFTGSKLTLKAQGPAAGLELEINGQVVAPPRKIKLNGSGNKLTVKGDARDLALRAGPNRVRVKNSNGWSNILVLSI